MIKLQKLKALKIQTMIFIVWLIVINNLFYSHIYFLNEFKLYLMVLAHNFEVAPAPPYQSKV